MAIVTNPTKKHYTEHQLTHAALILGESVEFLTNRLRNGENVPVTSPPNNTLINNTTFQHAVVQQRPSGQFMTSTTPTDTPPAHHNEYAMIKHPSTPNSIPFPTRSERLHSVTRPSYGDYAPATSGSGPYLNPKPPASNLSSTTPSSCSDCIPASPIANSIPPNSSNESLPPFNASGTSDTYGIHLDDQLSPPIDMGELASNSFADPLREAQYLATPARLHRGNQPINAQLYLMNGEPACTRPPPEGRLEDQDRHKRVRSNHQISQHGANVPETQRAVASASPSSDSMNNPKSCLRCRFQHLKCVPDPTNLDGPCLSCKKLKRPTLARLPCYWLMMTDAFLYRDQIAPNLLHTNRWRSMQVVNVDQWEDNGSKWVRVGHVAMDKSYPLRVRRFVPLDGDELDEKWVVQGVEKRHALAPYAIADMREAVVMFKQFIIENVLSYITAFINTDDPLYVQTYKLAYTMAYSPEYKEGPKAIVSSTTNINAMKFTNIAYQSEEERLLLREAFELWVCCRKTSNPERFFGAERLGVDVVNDPASPWHNNAPIPPLMIAQMQCIFYSIFLPALQKSVLERLWSVCKRTQHKNWMTIYLTNFILLHSASMITRRNNEYARSLGQSTRYFNPGAISKLQEGCNNLLAHYHYFNKGRLFFQQALQPSGMQEIIDDIGLDSRQASLVSMTANLINNRKNAMDEVRNKLQFEHDSFWVSQMYVKGWIRSATV